MDTSLVVGAVACMGAVPALGITLAIVSYRREQARQDALGQWANGHGWTVTQKPAADWWQRMPGRNKRGVTLALDGALGGRSVTIAEYFYTETQYNSVGSPAHRTRTFQYVLLIVRLRQEGPTIAVVERGAWSRFGRVLFGDSATAVGQEDFDRAYKVATKDPFAVSNVLTPTLVQAHLDGQLP